MRNRAIEKERAATLVLALLMMSLFLVMGIGFLTQRSAQNRAARASLDQVQARMLAEGGLQDALSKLKLRHDFPPITDDSQTVFEYTETVRTPTGDALGTYTVEIDTSYSHRPFWLMRIVSRGRVGDASAPQAEKILYAELDVSEFDRATVRLAVPTPNPNYYRCLFVTEGQSE